MIMKPSVFWQLTNFPLDYFSLLPVISISRKPLYSEEGPHFGAMTWKAQPKLQGKRLLSQTVLFLLLTYFLLSPCDHVTQETWHFPKAKVSAGVNVLGLMAADSWFPAAKAEFNLKLPLGRTRWVTRV